MRRRDGVAGFRVNLDEFQPVSNGFIVQDHAGRIGGVFRTTDENVEGSFDGKALFRFRLLYGIDTVRKQLGFRPAVLVRGDGVALIFPGGFIAARRFQIHLEYRAFFRCFHQSRFIVNLIVAAELHESMTAVQHFVFHYALIGDDRFLGLLRRGSGVHENVLVRGLVAGWRHQLHDLIHAGPEFVSGNRRIVSCGFQALHDNSTFFKQDIALPVGDGFARQHLEHRAGQHRVAAGTGHVGGFAGVFVLVPFEQLQLHAHRPVGSGKIGDLIGLYRAFQGDFLKEIARRRAVLLHDVPAFADGFGKSNAVFIRHHRGGQTFSVLIVIENIELHTGNGISVFPVRFRQPNPALGGLVFYGDINGFQVFF